MKYIKSYVLIIIISLGILPIRAMFNRLSKIPKTQPMPRRNISILPKAQTSKTLTPASPSTTAKSESMQNPFIKSAEQQLNQPVDSWFQNIQKLYQVSPVSSLVTSLAWTAALGLLPFGIVIIDLDKIMDGLQSIRKKIEPFFFTTTSKVLEDTKSEQEIKLLSDSQENKSDDIPQE